MYVFIHLYTHILFYKYDGSAGILCCSGLLGILLFSCLWGNLCVTLRGFQYLPYVYRWVRRYSSSFRIFAYDPRFVCPHAGHKGVVTSDLICLLPFHVCISALSISVTEHADPRAQPAPHEAMCVPQHPLPPLWRVLGTLPTLATPTPHFPCQERSNYTEISTEKDRLLLWHQRQDSCKSGAAAAAASGPCAGCRGALTSTALFAPSLPSFLGLYLCPGPQSLVRYPSQWKGWGSVVSQKMTRNRCSMFFPKW